MSARKVVYSALRQRVAALLETSVERVTIDGLGLVERSHFNGGTVYVARLDRRAKGWSKYAANAETFGEGATRADAVADLESKIAARREGGAK